MHKFQKALNEQKPGTGWCSVCNELKTCARIGVLENICQECLDKKKVIKEKQFSPKEKK